MSGSESILPNERLQPWLDLGDVQLYHGDCREILPALDLPDDTVTVTDPPYGDTSLEWDRWVGGWANLLPPTQAWVFGSLRMWFEHGVDEFDDWKLAQDIVWEKHNGSGFHADRFRRVHEHAVHYYRGEWSELYRDVQVTMDATKRTVRTKSRPTHTGHIDATPYQSEDGGPRLMRSVLQVRSEHGRAVHPTQKPVGILTPLIEFSTPAGGTVLDPFAGSGSTLVAARMLGRHAIGIERRIDYLERAAERLAQGSLLAAEATA